MIIAKENPITFLELNLLFNNPPIQPLKDIEIEKTDKTSPVCAVDK